MKVLSGFGGLWLRFVLAFVAVALAALTLDTAIDAHELASQIGVVARYQQDSLAAAAAYTAGAAYQGIGWPRANIDPVVVLARRAGAAVSIHDLAGRPVGVSREFARYPATGERSLPVMVGSRRVGMISVRFGPHGIGKFTRDFLAARWWRSAIAAVVATVLALIVAIAVARLVIAPIEVVLSAMRARSAGHRDCRIASARGPRELRELLEGINDAMDAVDEMDRLQRDLVANLAHEIRTPIAILQAETEALVDGVTQATPMALASLQEEVLRLGQMVEDMQRLAAAESAALHLKLEPADLAVIAAGATERFDDLFAAGGVTLIKRLESAVVLCDRDRIHEVVSNLLTNALKFTPPGGSVAVQTRPQADRQALLAITDTGIGIGAADLPHLTERFFRGQRSASMASGSGIGLAIVNDLVRAHRGDLSIWSEEAKGTQVTVTLPMARPGVSLGIPGQPGLGSRRDHGQS